MSRWINDPLSACFAWVRQHRSLRHSFRELPWGWWHETMNTHGRTRWMIDGHPLQYGYRGEKFELEWAERRGGDVFQIKMMPLDDMVDHVAMAVGLMCERCGLISRTGWPERCGWVPGLPAITCKTPDPLGSDEPAKRYRHNAICDACLLESVRVGSFLELIANDLLKIASGKDPLKQQRFVQNRERLESSRTFPAGRKSRTRFYGSSADIAGGFKQRPGLSIDWSRAIDLTNAQVGDTEAMRAFGA